MGPKLCVRARGRIGSTTGFALPYRYRLPFQLSRSQRIESLKLSYYSGHGDIPMSVKAIKSGAVEFLTMPFDDEDLLGAVRQALVWDLTGRQEQAECAVNDDTHARREAKCPQRPALPFAAQSIAGPARLDAIQLSACSRDLTKGPLFDADNTVEITPQ